MPKMTDRREHAAVSQGQFFLSMQQLDDKLQDYHRRGREHVDEQVGKILTAFTEHENSDRLIEQGLRDRVLRIETERTIEKQTSARRGAIAGSIGAGIVLGFVETVKRIIGKP
jgi:hypothetical protein